MRNALLSSFLVPASLLVLSCGGNSASGARPQGTAGSRTSGSGGSSTILKAPGSGGDNSRTLSVCNPNDPNAPCHVDGPTPEGCGDGVLDARHEACDDGNRDGGDGCAANCLSVEPGYSCIPAGVPCHLVARCGDGVIAPSEACDDNNKNDGDGCSSICKVEIGWKCDGNPSKCSHTTCGDSKVEGAEGCDDGNGMPFDGCSSECQNEPQCTGTSGCSSRCGDAIVLNEQCDDGNNIDGDGCSSTCTVEAGFKCSQPALGDKMEVPIVYRDFKYHTPSDFEAGVTGSETASTGMVKPELDADGKPVFTGTTGSAIHVESAASFVQWYHDTNGVNHATAGKLGLWNNGKGAYVNRYGKDGEQWNVTEPANWCGTVGQELKDADGKAIPCTFQFQQSADNPTGSLTDCLKEEAKGYTQLPGSCKADNGGTYKAQYITQKVDGNPLFFPIDGDSFSKSEMAAAQVPSVPAGLYDASNTWPYELDAAGVKVLHNFSFTSEVRYWFKYDSKQTYQLDFVGDDDVWVFINKKLAVDLGGIHTPVPGSVTINATTAGKLGLSDGNVYEVAVFQAERQTTCSSYKLTMSGFNAAPSLCTPICGDGVVSAGEECDDGKNTGTGYGECGPGCVNTPFGFCGDGITQDSEDCDDGNQVDGDECPSACRIIDIAR